MKKTLSAFLLAVVLMTAALPSAAQFRIGPRIGFNASKLHFNKEVFDADNRVGFNGGLMVEFTAPIIGVGFDASVMYVHRSVANQTIDNTSVGDLSRDYIEIPLNLKWKIGIPVVGKIVTPYLFTGPSFAFLTSKKDITAAYKNRSVDVAWNVGFGLQLFNHLQIGAGYGFGITKAAEIVGVASGGNVEGKDRVWTITAAYLF